MYKKCSWRIWLPTSWTKFHDKSTKLAPTIYSPNRACDEGFLFCLYRIRFAIWDYDHSYGRDGDNELNMLKTTVNCNKAILFKRLSKIPEYESRLKKRWLALRAQQIISYENFAEHIRENDKRINREIKRNFDKWPLNEKWYHDDQGYEQELELMQSFVKIRISQLDTYFNEL